MPKVRNIAAALPEPETVDFRALASDWAEGRTDLFVVLGPTASGKTRYAVRMAGEICEALESDGITFGGAEIISADSRQVYRGMDIGTGKDLCEYGSIPYHLIDIADPGERYNVYRFCEDFLRVWSDMLSRKVVPILCGGTGLYINAVTAGYDFTNRQPLSAARDTTERHGYPARPYFIGTLASREERNARIDRRLDARLDEGMVDEVRGLLERGVPEETLLGYGLEYRFVTLYLTGKISREDMRDSLATAIHQFAKRQMTWFRGMERSGVCIHWVEP